MPRNALGRGLGALIREPEPKAPPESAPIQPQATTPGGAAVVPTRETVHMGPREVDIDLVEPSPYQPRTRFREESLDELARSIRASGIIQPLVVRPIGSRFQLIAGERRWRAAQRAGLNKVTVIVKQVPDELALEMTLVENIQREDLNAIEAARAFERLMDEFHLTQESVAERTGKDRATVANAVRLLKLEPTIQDWVEEGKLSAGHGRALLAVQDGLLKLDEPASKTLTEWQGDRRREITVAQLLSHTSGLDPDGDVIYSAHDQFIAALRVQPIAPPGARFQYGAVGYQAFGEILRRKLQIVLTMKGMLGKPILRIPCFLRYLRIFTAFRPACW